MARLKRDIAAQDARRGLLSHYFDTSFLAPLIRKEKTSRDVAAFMRRLPAGELSTSHWTRVEFASAMARDVRMRILAAADAVRANAEFDAILSSGFVLITPAGADFDKARTFLQRFDSGLRAADALHLATAESSGAKTFYTLDEKLLRAGKLLGLPASRGI
ncbi:MAG: type II toxin-antitoxin system VapC family toxin [Rhizomicrobium sp.]